MCCVNEYNKKGTKDNRHGQACNKNMANGVRRIKVQGKLTRGGRDHGEGGGSNQHENSKNLKTANMGAMTHWGNGTTSKTG